MDKEQEIQAEYQGELEIGDIIIPCAVLKDGTRIIGENGIASNLGASGGKSYKLRDKMEISRGGPVPMFLASKALEPFIDEVFDESDLSPVEYDSGGKTNVGYRAEILPKVCEIWLKAREEDRLQSSQLAKAKKAEILMRGLAHIGITALVDEATGYQYAREKFELQKILTAYVSDEIAKWQLTFKIDFYKELFRLWNQPFNPSSIKKPSFVGTLTNKFIYKALPPGVFEAVKENTPKTVGGNNKYRFHQSLTPEVGREHLKNQIIEVTALMSVCDTKQDFIDMFHKKYDDQYQHLMELGDIPNEKKSPLSEHNQALKTALAHNPKD